MIKELIAANASGDISDESLTSIVTAIQLLGRAAGSLQDYCTEINGDLNDSLATEIEKFLSGV